MLKVHKNQIFKQKNLKLPVTNLEDIGNRKIEKLLGSEKQICKSHSLSLPSHQLLKYCTRRNSNIFLSIEYKMNCLMMQTTLSLNYVAYASMTNQGPENNLKPRNKFTLIRAGILDCRGKPLLQNLEQITLNDIKINNLRKLFTVLGYFHL